MATLKISELSVGDWVEIDHEDYGWQPAQINVCGDLGIGAYFKDIDPEEEYDCTLSQARPIPITPEILEANGFEPPRVGIGLDTWFWSNKRDMALELRRYVNDKWHLAYQIKDKAQAHLLFPLYHIHELQHIIRLLYIDKEIVMPKK